MNDNKGKVETTFSIGRVDREPGGGQAVCAVFHHLIMCCSEPKSVPVLTKMDSPSKRAFVGKLLSNATIFVILPLSPNSVHIHSSIELFGKPLITQT